MIRSEESIAKTASPLRAIRSSASGEVDMARLDISLAPQSARGPLPRRPDDSDRPAGHVDQPQGRAAHHPLGQRFPALAPDDDQVGSEPIRLSRDYFRNLVRMPGPGDPEPGRARTVPELPAGFLRQIGAVRQDGQHDELSLPRPTEKVRGEAHRGVARAGTVGGGQNLHCVTEHEGTVHASLSAGEIWIRVFVPSTDSMSRTSSTPSSERSSQTCFGSWIRCSMLACGGADPRKIAIGPNPSATVSIPSSGRSRASN